jgi:hypothetical protein
MVTQPGHDVVFLHHHFELPDLSGHLLDRAVYNQAPWRIYRQENGWLYLGVLQGTGASEIFQVAFFSKDHSHGALYHSDPVRFNKGGMVSITLFPTDQILLARLLAHRQGMILHSAGMALNGAGLLFAGHSTAGKSTIVKQLRSSGEILCDDRNIVRRYPHGFQLFGTWSHGDVPDVSPRSVPLRAILFLEKAAENRLIPIENRRETIHRLLPLVVKPLVTADWWEMSLTTVSQLVREVPVYRLQFDLSGRVMDVLRPLL